MTDQIPETGQPVDVEIEFEADDDGLEITLELGEASIKVSHTWEDPQSAALLVQALPQALMKVQEAINAEGGS